MTSFGESPRILHVYDLDDTLFATQYAAAQFAKACDDVGLISRQELDQARDIAQRKCVSFADHRYVREVIQKAPEEQQAAKRALLADAEMLFTERGEYDPVFPRYLYPDVIPHIRRVIADQDVLPMISTKGDFYGQTFKLQASGLAALPHMITDRTDKVRIINGWFNPETRRYELSPEEITNLGLQAGSMALEMVSFFDDKPASFEGYQWSDHFAAYHVRRTESVRPSQQGALPPNVHTLPAVGGINGYYGLAA